MIFESVSEALTKETPFVVYRNPLENELHFIGQDSNELHYLSSFSEKGYVFAPFDDKSKIVWMQPNKVLHEPYLLQEEENRILDFQEPEGIEVYLKLVEKTIETINRESLGKVVVSRREEVSVTNFEAVPVFKKMLNLYKSAYVYLWYHPKVGLWMGATPETLLSVEDKSFTTMALAGTQPYNGNIDVDCGEKELEEQQMVTDYIKENLSGNVSNVQFSDVETVKAGKLLHLKTDIQGVLTSSNDLEKVISLLHPTPAVCGLPREESKAFILENEGYYRSFYTGYLGALNMNNQTSLYVNLRCFEYTNDRVYLYVGGGITKQSHPKKEWLETVEKSYTIKKVLF